MSIIEIKVLEKIYNENTDIPVHAVNNVNLSF